MKHFKVLLLTSLVVLLTTYANANINMAPIITYLLSDTEPQGEITINDPALKKVIASTFDNTHYSPEIDIQGVIDAGGLTVTVPYTVTNAPVTLEAYSTSVILDASVTQDDETGIVATFAWTEQTNLPVGSGTFTATITIDDSGASIPDNTYNAKQLDVEDDSAGLVAAAFSYATDNVGGTGTLTLEIMPGIPDRMFGQADNTGNTETHKFLYLSVTNTTTGKTWLNNNLGANYANINDPVFDPAQQAIASNDHNAYGSLFQWGRKADGHELITWTDGATGTGTNGTTTVNSDDPADALFILVADFLYDWRVTQDDTLWASESSVNNVCPVGYRVPTGSTGGELDLERLSWESNNAAGALDSTLALTKAGDRNIGDGTVFDVGTAGIYWGSTVSDIGSLYLVFTDSNAEIGGVGRAFGLTVRCIKVSMEEAASNEVLAQIGAEGDSGDTVNSVVTVAQLAEILPPLTGIVSANEVAYQDYIDANPDLFSIPATQAEVQAMVDAVNGSVIPANITINNAALQKIIASVYDDTPYTPAIDIQGVIDAGGLTVTVPYTVSNAPATLEAYSTSVTLDAAVTQDDETGIVATFAWTEQTNLPIGSGTFTATITIDDSAGNEDTIYNAKKLDIEDYIAGLVAAVFPYDTDNAGGTGMLTLKIMPGIPDRMFGLPDNNGDDTTHEFLYLPVTNTTTGKTWLNNNLGANYANVNSSTFNIAQQATASDDHNAYGSLFQWGRKADGHELITWTDGATGAGTNGTTTVNSDDPADALFILELDSPYDWRVTQDDTLWASESSENNVCPIGYRLPTGSINGELDLERQSWGSSDAAGALASALVMPMSGYRNRADVLVFNAGTGGVYWGSTVSGTNAQSLYFNEVDSSTNWNARASGFTVRCIRDEEGNIDPLPTNITIDNAALQKAIGSIFDDTPYYPAIEIQGVIDAGGLTVTVPYTVSNASTTLPAYRRSATLGSSVTEDDEAGIIATFAWEEQTNLPVGSGTFSATITIDDSGTGIPDDTYNAKKLDIENDIIGLVAATFPYATDDVGGTGTLTLKIYPGIPDRMFGEVDNTGDDTTHDFLYLPVTNTTTGKIWLSNNLGANYANINSPVFNIAQQATASDDHNAYGSLFQWGRKADGHELITWTNGATGTSTNGTTTVNSNDPADALFILEPDSPWDWRVTQDDTLWASESSENNVCPIGYRLPTGSINGELDLERQSWGSSDAAGALASALVMPLPSYHHYTSGTIYYEGTSGYYWGSTVSDVYAQSLHFNGDHADMLNYPRAFGFSVRCLKN